MQEFSFGIVRIDGATCDYDVVIDRGRVRKRKKKPSRKFRDEFGHTPPSVEEKDNRILRSWAADAGIAIIRPIPAAAGLLRQATTSFADPRWEAEARYSID